MKKKIFTSLGQMSGTSMDGVDISLIETDGYDILSKNLTNIMNLMINYIEI